MGEPRPPGEGAAEVVARIRALESRVAALEVPSGSQRFGTVGYLAGLRTLGSSGANSLVTSAQPADGVIRWFTAGLGQDKSTWHRLGPFEAPTRRVIVTGSIGEASLTPQGGFMIGYVSYRLMSGGWSIADPGAELIRGQGADTGRLYTNIRMGAGISTGPQLVEIPEDMPGPFYCTLNVGIWGATANTGPVAATWNTPALQVQVVG